jgi:hypothetical protein
MDCGSNSDIKLIMMVGVVMVVVLPMVTVRTRASLVVTYIKVRFSYRAWWLHPWFSINLHGKSLPGPYHNR